MAARPRRPGNSGLFYRYFANLQLTAAHNPLDTFSTNGGPPPSNDILLDDVPDTTIVQNQFIIIPSVEATQEFKVQSNSIKAEFGHTGGGVVRITDCLK